MRPRLEADHQVFRATRSKSGYVGLNVDPDPGHLPSVVNRSFGATQFRARPGAHFTLSLPDRGYVMETGRIALEGTGHDLRERPKAQVAYLGM